MNRLVFFLFFAVPFALAANAQPAPTPQPTALQTQTAPCSSPPSASQKSPSIGIAVKPPTKWQLYLDAQRKALASKYGVVLPDTPTQLPLVPKTTSQPCLPQAQAATATPVSKLPPDTTVTLHCNPMTPSTKDAAHPTTLTLPDPHDFAVPKAGDFEGDNVVPDLGAKTPCYLIKVNPKSQRPFIQQQ